MIRNIIFDFGNVLVHFDPPQIVRACAPSCSGEDQALLARVCFDRAWWDRMDAGTLDEPDAAALACAQLPGRLHPAVRAIFADWYRVLPEWDGMAALLADLKARGFRLYLLSNISRYFAAHCAALPILQPFDGLELSGPIGLVKPSAEIFAHLCARFGLRPGECLFIDDTARNVDGAKSAGIDAILFPGDADVLRALLGTRLGVVL